MFIFGFKLNIYLMEFLATYTDSPFFHKLSLSFAGKFQAGLLNTAADVTVLWTNRTPNKSD